MRECLRGALLVVLVAVTATAAVVAQDDDHALRLWLIDRIEQAYADNDAETLRRMAAAAATRHALVPAERPRSAFAGRTLCGRLGASSKMCDRARTSVRLGR